MEEMQLLIIETEDSKKEEGQGLQKGVVSNISIPMFTVVSMERFHLYAQKRFGS